MDSSRPNTIDFSDLGISVPPVTARIRIDSSAVSTNGILAILTAVEHVAFRAAENDLQLVAEDVGREFGDLSSGDARNIKELQIAIQRPPPYSRDRTTHYRSYSRVQAIERGSLEFLVAFVPACYFVANNTIAHSIKEAFLESNLHLRLKATLRHKLFDRQFHVKHSLADELRARQIVRTIDATSGSGDAQLEVRVRDFDLPPH